MGLCSLALRVAPGALRCSSWPRRKTPCVRFAHFSPNGCGESEVEARGYPRRPQFCAARLRQRPHPRPCRHERVWASTRAGSQRVSGAACSATSETSRPGDFSPRAYPRASTTDLPTLSGRSEQRERSELCGGPELEHRRAAEGVSAARRTQPRRPVVAQTHNNPTRNDFGSDQQRRRHILLPTTAALPCPTHPAASHPNG